MRPSKLRLDCDHWLTSKSSMNIQILPSLCLQTLTEGFSLKQVAVKFHRYTYANGAVYEGEYKEVLATFYSC